MEPMEINLQKFIVECQRDLPTPVINHDKHKMMVAIDYGTLEHTVLIYYLQTETGKTLLSQMFIAGNEKDLDSLLSARIVDEPESFIRSRDIPYTVESIRDRSDQHDRAGNYRFDYGRNNHPRSPRKR